MSGPWGQTLGGSHCRDRTDTLGEVQPWDSLSFGGSARTGVPFVRSILFLGPRWQLVRAIIYCNQSDCIIGRMVVLDLFLGFILIC